MGVRGIMRILKEGISSYGVRFEFSAPDNEQGTKERQENAIIIVDASAFAYWAVTEAVGAVPTHTDYSLLSDFVYGWYQSCLRCGVRCIFVFDGMTPLSKLATKLRRMQQQSSDLHSLRGTPTDQIKFINQNLRIPPFLAFSCIKESLALAGAEVYTASEEADEQLLRYAYRYNAFGILSEDSDILLTSIQGKFFGLIPLSLFEISNEDGCIYGHIFHAERFTALSKISLLDLPLLATLAGNDMSSLDSLRVTHGLTHDHLHQYKNLKQCQSLLPSQGARMQFPQIHMSWYSDQAPGVSAGSIAATATSADATTAGADGSTDEFISAALGTMHKHKCGKDEYLRSASKTMKECLAILERVSELRRTAKIEIDTGNFHPQYSVSVAILMSLLTKSPLSAIIAALRVDVKIQLKGKLAVIKDLWRECYKGFHHYTLTDTEISRIISKEALFPELLSLKKLGLFLPRVLIDAISLESCETAVAITRTTSMDLLPCFRPIRSQICNILGIDCEHFWEIWISTLSLNIITEQVPCPTCLEDIDAIDLTSNSIQSVLRICRSMIFPPIAEASQSLDKLEMDTSLLSTTSIFMLVAGVLTTLRSYHSFDHCCLLAIIAELITSAADQPRSLSLPSLSLAAHPPSIALPTTPSQGLISCDTTLACYSIWPIIELSIQHFNWIANSINYRNSNSCAEVTDVHPTVSVSYYPSTNLNFSRFQQTYALFHNVEFSPKEHTSTRCDDLIVTIEYLHRSQLQHMPVISSLESIEKISSILELLLKCLQ